MKKVYLVCASGIATSSMLRVKIEEFFEEKGIDAMVTQFRIAELSPDRIDADVIVATTSIPPEIEENFHCINGLPFLTGVGEEEAFNQLEEALK